MAQVYQSTEGKSKVLIPTMEDHPLASSFLDPLPKCWSQPWKIIHRPHSFLTHCRSADPNHGRSSTGLILSWSIAKLL